MLNTVVVDARRKELGLSVARLARLIGVDTYTVHHWRYGRYGPGPESLAKLAKALGVPAEELLDSEPKPAAKRSRPTSSPRSS